MSYDKLFPTQALSTRFNLKKYYQSIAQKHYQNKRTTAVNFPGFNNTLNKPMSNKTTKNKMKK